MNKTKENLMLIALSLLAVVLMVAALYPAERSEAIELPPVIMRWEAEILTNVTPLSATLPAERSTVPQDQTPDQEPVPRYADIAISEEERRELAEIIYLEAGNQCAEGQQAVAEVVLNRVISPDFPNTVQAVLHEGEGTRVEQFATIGLLGTAEPTATQYEAIDRALYGPSILPDDVVFFSRNGENDRVWGTIQDHVFCYKYLWE